jgi:hypothetical protein
MAAHVSYHNKGHYMNHLWNSSSMKLLTTLASTLQHRLPSSYLITMQILSYDLKSFARLNTRKERDDVIVDYTCKRYLQGIKKGKFFPLLN